METKTQRKERLRNMRQKYHLGEYKNSNRKVYKVHTIKNRMVKHRFKKHSRHSRGSSANIWGLLMGTAGVLVYQNYLSQYLEGLPKLGIEMVAGYWLSSKKGFVGNFGKALVIIDAYALLHTYLSPMISQVTGTGGTQSLTNYY
jgi:hypothetical protein